MKTRFPRFPIPSAGLCDNTRAIRSKNSKGCTKTDPENFGFSWKLLDSLDIREWPENWEFRLVIVPPMFNLHNGYLVTLHSGKENDCVPSRKLQYENESELPIFRPFSDI